MGPGKSSPAELRIPVQFPRWHGLRNCDRSSIARPACRACPAGRSDKARRYERGVEEAIRVTFLLSGMPAYVYGRAQMDELVK